jgi:phosphopantothenoylcysteine decarboxylase/phosphopantothenate--cysteine ligase
LLTGKNVLVTVGSTIEYIDPIRVITNLSSGKMGNAIAEEARKIGTNVTIIYGHVPCGFLQSQDFNVIKVSTTNEMYNAIVCELSSKKYDIVILAAAVTDFAIGEKNLREKIDTRKGKLLISLTPTKKIIDHVKRVSKNNIFLVAFKAEYNMANPDIIEKAYKKLKECNGDLIVANDIGREGAGVGSDNGEVFIIDKHKKVNHLPLQNKRDIARSLLYTIERYIDSS